MTDREFEAQRKRVRREMNKWRNLMGLGSWAFSYVYCREGLDVPDGYAAEGRTCLMRVNSAWEYCEAEIAISMPMMLETPDEELSRICIHEMMHVLVAELREGADDIRHEERVVTMLTKAAMWMMEGAALGERKKLKGKAVA